MRKEWALPSEKSFRNTGGDWLQVLLDTVPEDIRGKILLLLWRCWHLREDSIRNDGKESISGSVQFLKKYAEELKMATMAGDVLNAGAVDRPRCPTKQQIQWSCPVRGTVKLNTDAAFQTETGESTAGAVARDSRGLVIVSICRNLSLCQSVEEAEAKAALAGLLALMKYYSGPFILEMDCQTIVKEVTAGYQSRTPCYALIKDIREALSAFPAYDVIRVGRKCNALAHGLAAATKSIGAKKPFAAVRNVLLRDIVPKFE